MTIGFGTSQPKCGGHALGKATEAERKKALDAHGIRSWSPSNIGLAKTCLSTWCAKYVFKLRDRTGAAMARGNAVEAIIRGYLALAPSEREGSEDELIAAALAEFDLAELNGNPEPDKWVKERKNVEKIAQQMLPKFAEYPVPNWHPPNRFGKHEKYVETQIEGAAAAIGGFTDFDWDGASVQLTGDAKTRGSALLKDKATGGWIVPYNNRLQFEVYIRALGNREFRGFYGWPSGSAFLRVERSEEVWRDVQRTVHALEQFLAISHDKEELLALLPPPDFSHAYLFSDLHFKDQVKQLFGIKD